MLSSFDSLRKRKRETEKKKTNTFYSSFAENLQQDLYMQLELEASQNFKRLFYVYECALSYCVSNSRAYNI